MREDHQRLRKLMLMQFENNGIKPGGKEAAKAEYYMLIGYLAMQAEIEEQVDPYLTMLAMSGRRLTQEKVE